MTTPTTNNPPAKNYRNILSSLGLLGYDNLEPIIFSMAALGRNLFLRAKHGVGKTTLAQLIAHAYDGSWLYIDCAKCDLIGLLGIPDMEKSRKSGKLSFIDSNSNIFNKDVVILDELPRANKQMQNLYLEILEQRTAQGVLTNNKLIIATANLETYHGNFQMDEALLDRMWGIIPIEFNIRDAALTSVESAMESSMEEELALAQGKSLLEVKGAELRDLFEAIRTAYADISASDDGKKIVSYASSLIHMTDTNASKGHADADKTVYTSPRTGFRNFPIAVKTAAAYYKAIGRANYLVPGAVDAAKYCLSTKAEDDKYASIVESLHRQFRTILEAKNFDEAAKMRIDLARATDVNSKIQVLDKYLDKLATDVNNDELTEILGDTFKLIQETGPNMAGQFLSLLHRMSQNGCSTQHIISEAEGWLLCEFQRLLFKQAYVDGNAKSRQLMESGTVSFNDLTDVLART